jgi:hypothetical protein
MLMFERVWKPVAIGVLTGSLLTGCSEAQTTQAPEQSAHHLNHPNKTLGKIDSSCTTLDSYESGIKPASLETTIALSGISSVLEKNPNLYKIFSQLDPLTHQKTSVNAVASASFLRIIKQNKSLCFIDSITGPQDESEINSILTAVEADKEFITAAFNSKPAELKAIDFRVIKKDTVAPANILDSPQFIGFDTTSGTTQPTVEYPFNPRTIIKVADLRTMLRHEVFHSLTSRSDMSFGNELVNSTNANTFGMACSAVRKLAINDASKSAQTIKKDFEYLMRFATPKQKAVFSSVLQELENGTFASKQLNSGNSTSEQRLLYGYGNVPECKLVGPWYVSIRQMDAMGITYENLFNNPRVSEKIDGLIDGWNNILRQGSIYNSIREATYLYPDSNSNEKLEGHPWDNWDETIASTLNVALTYPEKFVENVHKLDFSQKTAIKQLFRVCSSTFSTLHPEMTEIDKQLKNIYSKL